MRLGRNFSGLFRAAPCGGPVFGEKLAVSNLFRIFGCARDTPARQNATCVCFCPRFFRIFGFAEDTPARQNAGKLAFALAYS